MKLELILALLGLHWLADFVFQSHWMATNKSKSLAALSIHVITYSSTVLVGCVLINTDKPLTNSLWFGLLTFICHWITDYFTSKVNARLYQQNKIHDFFVMVGFDQLLHYTQLLICYKLLLV